MSEAPTWKISTRAKFVWRKLSDWYGADMIAKQLAAIAPEDWCICIDAIPSRTHVDRVLIAVRQQHPKFPPRFPEFEQLVNKLTKPQISSGPSVHEQLGDFVVRTYRPTLAQRRGMVTLYARDQITGDLITTGVYVPADGDEQAYRVSVASMQTQLPQEF